jgi:hypothetical protein
MKSSSNSTNPHDVSLESIASQTLQLRLDRQNYESSAFLRVARRTALKHAYSMLKVRSETYSHNKSLSRPRIFFVAAGKPLRHSRQGNFVNITWPSEYPSKCGCFQCYYTEPTTFIGNGVPNDSILRDAPAPRKSTRHFTSVRIPR